MNRNLQISPGNEPLQRSQIFTMIALVLFGLGLFTLVVRAGMHEKARPRLCETIVNAADRAICEQAANPAPPPPAKGALAPAIESAGDSR